MKPLYWPSLLYRQTVLLGFVTGIAASRFPLPSLCAMSLLLFLQRTQLKTVFHLLLVACVCGSGFFYGAYRTPSQELEPAWLEEASVSSEYRENAPVAAVGSAARPLWLPEKAYSKGVRVWAVVDEVESLPDRRLRLMLSHVTPVSQAAKTIFDGLRQGADTHSGGRGYIWPEREYLAALAGPAASGRVVVTWAQSLTPEGERSLPPGLRPFTGRKTGNRSPDRLLRRPVPGELIAVTLRLQIVHSLRNPGLWQVEDYWAERGAWHRAWMAEEQGTLELSGLLGKDVFEAIRRVQDGEQAEIKTVQPVSSASLWRDAVRRDLLRVLPRGPVAYPADESFSGGVLNSAVCTPQAEITAGGAILMALVLDDRYLMNSDELDLFARSTLSHSLALSGMHLGYVAAGVYLLVRLLWRFCPILHRLPVSRQQCAVAAALAPATFYLWLSGAPPSLMRAYIMLLVWGLLLWLRRPGVLMDGLIAAVAVIALLWPGMLFDVSLQLSILAIASMALCLPFVARFAGLAASRIAPEHFRYARGGGCYPRDSTLRRWAARAAFAAVSLLGVSLGAQIVLMPLLVKTFGLYGLCFPLNLLWLPILGVWVMPCALAGTVLAAANVTGAAAWLMQLAVIPCDVLLDILHLLNRLGALPVSLPPRPHWLSMLGFWFLLACLPSFVMRLRSMRQKPGMESSSRISRFALPCLLPCLGVALILLPFAATWLDARRDVVRLRLLDVGQGQAVLVEWRGGRMLVDGGGLASPRFDVGRDVVTATLAEGRWPSLDFMVATHPDTDHIQGLVFPLRHIPVGYYADNGRASDNASYAALHGMLQEKNMRPHALQAGDTLDLGCGLTVEVLNPLADIESAFADTEDEHGSSHTNAVSVSPAAFAESADNMDGNDASLVLRLVWKGRPLALLCGDIEQKGQRALLNRLRSLGWREEQGAAPSLQSEILVLPHHGAAGASLENWYAAVRPRAALVSCGYANRWRFPAETTLKRLARAGISVFRTDLDGQIVVEWADVQEPYVVTTTTDNR